MVNNVTSRNELLTIIQNLDAEEQLQLLEDLALIIRSKLFRKKHSILELKGLGKDLWSDIDAQEYVDKERDTWTG